MILQQKLQISIKITAFDGQRKMKHRQNKTAGLICNFACFNFFNQKLKSPLANARSRQKAYVFCQL